MLSLCFPTLTLMYPQGMIMEPILRPKVIPDDSPQSHVNDRLRLNIEFTYAEPEFRKNGPLNGPCGPYGPSGLFAKITPVIYTKRLN